jgi:hypothetical protein
MPSPLYRNHLINKICSAVREATEAKEIDHPALVGRIRELIAGNILRPMLPNGFELGTGKITNKHGEISSETDLIIFNRYY